MDLYKRKRGDIIEENAKIFIALLIFVSLVLVLEHVLYFDELYASTEFELILDELNQGLPAFWELWAWFGIIGSIIAWLFVSMFNVLALNVEGIPLLVRVFIMLPVWAFVGIIVFEALMKLIGVSTRVYDAIVPF